MASDTFRTLARENAFRNPSKTGPAAPVLEELVAPHIQSFDALFQDGANEGAGGLLDLAIKEIPSKVIFDSVGVPGVPTGWGNKLECW
jgi:DNA-directed RNA polymerase I subunit RPA2